MLPFGLTREEAVDVVLCHLSKAETGEGRRQAWPSVALVAVLRVRGQAAGALPLASLLWWRYRDRRLEMVAAMPAPNLSSSVVMQQRDG